MTYRDDEQSPAPESSSCHDRRTASARRAWFRKPTAVPTCAASDALGTGAAPTTCSAAAWTSTGFSIACAGAGCWRSAWARVLGGRDGGRLVVLVSRIVVGSRLVQGIEPEADAVFGISRHGDSQNSKSCSGPNWRYLKSRYVLQAALRDPSDRQPECAGRRIDDPVQWLTEELDIVVPAEQRDS